MSSRRAVILSLTLISVKLDLQVSSAFDCKQVAVVACFTYYHHLLDGGSSSSFDMLLLGHESTTAWIEGPCGEKKNVETVKGTCKKSVVAIEGSHHTNMMNAASDKCNNDQRYSKRCFPARTSLQRRKEGSGHWLDSYRKAEEQKHRHLRRRVKETSGKHESTTGSHSPHGKTLDAPLLLQLCCVDKPTHISSVDISEQNLNSVKPEDLRLFENLAHIDASANFLSLDSFSSFVSLRELNLTLNGLCNMTFNAADFPHLQVLDLSYNRLSADSITCIGGLPRLKVLHLTGNQLHHLPPDLGFSHHGASQLESDEENVPFKALEVLLLDENKLCSEVFNSLKNLKRLKHLNLQGNRISKIPYFPLMDSLEPLQTAFEEHGGEDGLASTEPNTDDNERILQQHWEEYRKRSWLPLPNLQYLCLADNKIAEEEALMPVALFPVIREIDICSNPLTVRRSGDPPLLTHYLQEGLGITIKRKKMQPVVQRPLKVSVDLKWKEGRVKDQIPKMSKKSPLLGKTRPAQVEKSEMTAKPKGDEETVQENAELFFLTEATLDAPEYGSSLQAEEKVTGKDKHTNKDDDIQVKLTHYEMLMDVNPNSDLATPIGIQTAVQMLEHTLRNLNVYRDSKPNLDRIQTPYRERQRKVTELPALKPRKPPAERVDEMMKTIRQSTTMREVRLSSAIHGTGVSKQEALLLLRDMKTKYETLYKKMMEQVAGS